MASRNSPGKSQLGHSPFGKEKLEGPKIHHDDHGPTASRPMKSNRPAVPNEHWEMRYNLGGPSKDMIISQGADFNPKRPRDRNTTHIKVNETDS
jgi:hypothetical protein